MSRTTNVRRGLLVALTVLSVIATLTAARADAKTEPAHGGRVQPHVCPNAKTIAKRVNCLVLAVKWERKNVRTANLELARVRVATPLMDTMYVCKIGEVVYHVPATHCNRVVGCESGGRPKLDEYGGSNGAGGATQYEPLTWAGTAFARAGFSLFDPLPEILAMDAYAAVHGFNTGGGWAASHSCHGYSGPEA